MCVSCIGPSDLRHYFKVPRVWEVTGARWRGGTTFEGYNVPPMSYPLPVRTQFTSLPYFPVVAVLIGMSPGGVQSLHSGCIGSLRRSGVVRSFGPPGTMWPMLEGPNNISAYSALFTLKGFVVCFNFYSFPYYDLKHPITNITF